MSNLTVEKIAESLLPLVAPIQDLHEDPANARKGHAIERIAASLAVYGQRKPIVVNRAQGGKVEAGNGTLRAAISLGWAHIAVVFVDDDAATAAAYGIADNRLGDLSEFDPDILNELMPTLEGLETGFTPEELAKLLPTPLVIEDEAPMDRAEELREKWGVENGSLWRLGEHRIKCGDATDPANVEAVMAGEKAHLVFTDPPYGVAIGAKNRMLNDVQRGGRKLNDIVDDALAPDDLKERLLPTFRNIRQMVMADDCTVFVTSPQGGELGMMMLAMMKEAGLPVRHVLIWSKNQPTFSMGRLDYDYRHEPILLTWGKKHKKPMLGMHRTSVWEIDRPRASHEHPTMKPVELVANALLNNSDKGDVVFDAYLGSGTTLIASEQLGRKCRAVEIEPGYVAVALERWHTLTGQVPELIP